MKAIKWLGNSLQRVKAFSDEARQQAGFELWEVQRGNNPSDWKPMPSIGVGACEIRLHAENEYRIIYVAKFPEAIYVLHAFPKKTQQTPKRDIEIAATRHGALLSERKPQ